MIVTAYACSSCLTAIALKLMKFSDKSPELFDFVVESNHRLSFTRKALIGLGTVCLVGLAYLPMEQEAETSPVSDAQITETTITHNSGKTTVLTIESTTTEKTASSTVLSTETSTTATIDTTTTTEQVREPLPWESHLYQEKDCSNTNSLKVVVQGEDGKAVTAQVSADYMIGKQKINEDGQPIDGLNGYSKYYVINTELPEEGSADGVREVCFDNIPSGASVYIETYKLERKQTENPHKTMQSTEVWYGGAMSNQIWPGLNQTVYLNLPKVCGGNSQNGSSGSIKSTVKTSSNVLNPYRVVAWSTGPGRAGHTFGFGVEDRQQNNTLTEDTVNGLVSGQNYLFQVQAVNSNGNTFNVKVSDVPVLPCKETAVDIVIQTNTSCIANVGDKALKCTLLDELIG